MASATAKIVAIVTLENRAAQGLRNLGRGFSGLHTQSSGLGGGFQNLGATTLRLGAAFAKVAAFGAVALAAGLAGLGVAALRAGIAFEDAFAGIEKTVEGLDDTLSGSTKTWRELLQEGVRGLAKEVPATVEELSNIGAIAGQLGIPKEAIIDFTRTIAALGATTNLTQEEAASQIARMSNIYAIKTGDIAANTERIGSTIVDLGNNFATTEHEILRFGLRVAGAGKLTGLTQADILSISAALSSVGVQAEAGGTAVQKVLLEIHKAVMGASTGFVDNTEAIDKNKNKLLDLNAQLVKLEAQTGMSGQSLWDQYQAFTEAGGAAEDFGRQLGDTRQAQLFQTIRAMQDLREETDLLSSMQGEAVSPKKLSQFAAAAGMTADEFKAAWKEDAGKAFQAFVEGLGAAGDDAINILDDLRLKDVRLQRAFLSLSNAGDLLGRTMDMSRGAWETNTAMAIEAEKRYRTAKSQLVIFKNAVRDLGITIGMRLIPFLGEMLAGVRPVIEEFGRKLPAIMDAVISKITELVEAFKIGGFVGLAEALGLTPEQVAIVENVIDRATQAFDFLEEHWRALVGALIAVAALLTVVAVITSLAAAVAAVTSPIGLIIIAVALLGAAWAENWFGIRDILTAFWNNTAKPIFDEVVAWLSDKIPIAIQAASEFWTTTLLPALTDVMGFIQAVIIPAFMDLVTWLQTNIPIAIQAASTFWETTLQPALEVVGAFIVGTVIPALGDLVTWLSTNIPVAIQAASDFWQSTLLPALTVVGDFISGTIVPILSDIVNWLSVNIPAAISTAAAFWNDTLLPALTAIGTFISDKIIPLFDSVLNVLMAVGNYAGEFFAAVWENKVLPALTAVWEFISSSVVPILELLGGAVLLGIKTAAEDVAGVWETVLKPALEVVWGFISETLGPVFQWLIDTLLGPLIDKMSEVSTSLTDIGDPITAVTDWLNSLADTINNLTLPEWLEGGSPPPLANWLQNIADGAVVANTNLGTMLGTLASQVTQAAGGLLQNIAGGLFKTGEGGEEGAGGPQAEAFTGPAQQIASGLQLALPEAIVTANLGMVVLDSITSGINANEDAKKRMARAVALGMLTYLTDEMSGVGSQMINFLVTAVSQRIGARTGAEVRP